MCVPIYNLLLTHINILLVFFVFMFISRYLAIEGTSISRSLVNRLEGYIISHGLWRIFSPEFPSDLLHWVWHHVNSVRAVLSTMKCGLFAIAPSVCITALHFVAFQFLTPSSDLFSALHFRRYLTPSAAWTMWFQVHAKHLHDAAHLIALTYLMVRCNKTIANRLEGVVQAAKSYAGTQFHRIRLRIQTAKKQQ